MPTRSAKAVGHAPCHAPTQAWHRLLRLLRAATSASYSIVFCVRLARLRQNASWHRRSVGAKLLERVGGIEVSVIPMPDDLLSVSSHQAGGVFSSLAMASGLCICTCVLVIDHSLSCPSALRFRCFLYRARHFLNPGCHEGPDPASHQHPHILQSKTEPESKSPTPDPLWSLVRSLMYGPVELARAAAKNKRSDLQMHQNGDLSIFLVSL